MESLKQIFNYCYELEEKLEKCYNSLEQYYGQTTEEQDESFAGLWFNIRGIKYNLNFLEENHGKR